MSHFSTCLTQMTDVNLIEKACNSLGLKTERKSFVRGWRRQCTQAELVVRMENNYDLGFNPSPDGSYYCIADFAFSHQEQNHGSTLQSLWQRIVARYHVEKSIAVGNSLGSTAKVNVSGV